MDKEISINYATKEKEEKSPDEKISKKTTEKEKISTAKNSQRVKTFHETIKIPENLGEKKRLISGIQHLCATFEELKIPKGLHKLNSEELQLLYDELLSSLETQSSGIDKIVIILLKLIEKFLHNRNIINIQGGTEILQKDPEFIRDLRIVCFKYLGSRQLGSEFRLALKVFATYSTIYQINKLQDVIKSQEQIKTDEESQKKEEIKHENNEESSVLSLSSLQKEEE